MISTMMDSDIDKRSRTVGKSVDPKFAEGPILYAILVAEGYRRSIPSRLSRHSQALADSISTMDAKFML